MKTNGPPLVPYLRQSRAKERTISIDEQRRDIQGWAQAAGVPLAAEIIEQNVSGSKPWRERGLGEAVDACERGQAAGIIVAWQDRLSRENGRATAEVWEALDHIGARLVCAAEGLDTATGDHEMLFTIKAAIAREQWKRYGANWRRARRSTVEAGFWMGRTPIGYRKRNKKLVPSPRETANVLEAFELRLIGMPYTEIGRRFGWSHSTTRQILMNRVYLGEIKHGEFVTEHAHDPIVPRDLFDAVQASRTSEPVPPGKTTAGRLVKGIARCAGCGRTLKTITRKRADGSYRVGYYCKNQSSAPCPDRAWVGADELDAYIAEWFEEALATARRMIDVVSAGRELEEAQAERREADAQLVRYVENTTIDDARIYQRGLAARQARLDKAEERVRQLSARLTRIPAGGSLATLWARFDVERRREVLFGFLERIEVRRGASSDLVGSIKIFWSDGSVADHERSVRKLAA